MLLIQLLILGTILRTGKGSDLTQRILAVSPSLFN